MNPTTSIKVLNSLLHCGSRHVIKSRPLLWMFTFVLMTLIACTGDHSVDPYAPRDFIAESEIIAEGKAPTTPPTSATKTLVFPTSLYTVVPTKTKS